jgi:hypothetical protein
MKLVARRSSLWITDYSLGDSPNLEKSLSVFDPHERRYTHRLYVYDERKRILKVPRGIGQQHVMHKLESDGILLSEDDVVDQYRDYSRPRTIDARLRDGYDLRDEHQQSSADFLLREKDAQKFLSLDVGYGKTFCTIYAGAQLRIPMLIICRTLGKQWVDFIHEYTYLHDDEVVEIVGSDSIRKLLNKEADGVFYVASIDTLRSYYQQGGSLQELSDHLGIGIKAFDEAHLNYVANMMIDVNMAVEHTVYLTATNGRSDKIQDRLFKTIFRFVPISGVDTHTLKQYYNIRYVNYNTFPRPDHVSYCSARRGFNAHNYATYIFNNHTRKTFFYGLIRRYVKQVVEADPEARILVVLDRLADIQSVHDIMTNDLKISVGRYCTLISNADEKEKELQKQVVLTTIGSGVVGKDIKNLRLVLATTAFSSPIITRQLLGRLRYLEGRQVYYFDFIDEGFPAMERQRRGRKTELDIRANSIDTFYVTMEEVVEELRREYTVPYTPPVIKPKVKKKIKKSEAAEKSRSFPIVYWKKKKRAV